MSTIFEDCDLDWSDGAEYRDTIFRNCVIRGPAILNVNGGHVHDSICDYEKGHRDGPLAAITYSDTPPRSPLPHVTIRNCEFADCEFMNVWIWSQTKDFPKSRLGQWWFMRRNFTFENVRRKIYRGDS